jgi:hypothetical protein
MEWARNGRCTVDPITAQGLLEGWLVEPVMCFSREDLCHHDLVGHW